MAQEEPCVKFGADYTGMSDVNWVRQIGIIKHPQWYPELPYPASDREIASVLYKHGIQSCLRPCDRGEEEGHFVPVAQAPVYADSEGWLTSTTFTETGTRTRTGTITSSTVTETTISETTQTRTRTSVTSVTTTTVTTVTIPPLTTITTPEPATTQPETTEPPTAEPPTTEPPTGPATELPATKPATEPAAPPATEPATTEPPTTEPPTTELPTTQPPTTRPPTTESPTTEPSTMEPSTSEPPPTVPPTTEPPPVPPTTEPLTTEFPTATEPATVLTTKFSATAQSSSTQPPTQAPTSKPATSTGTTESESCFKSGKTMVPMDAVGVLPVSTDSIKECQAHCQSAKSDADIGHFLYYEVFRTCHCPPLAASELVAGPEFVIGPLTCEVMLDDASIELPASGSLSTRAPVVTALGALAAAAAAAAGILSLRRHPLAPARSPDSEALLDEENRGLEFSRTSWPDSDSNVE